MLSGVAEPEACGRRGGETAIELCILCRMPRRVFAALLVLALDARALTQGARDGRLIVTVIDPSGAVIPGATVTIAGVDEVTSAAAIAPVKTSDKGVAAVEALTPGRYAIRAESPGFEIGTLTEVRIRRGDNKHVVVLAIFNDRPIGIGRNSVRADGQWTWNTGASYTRRMGVRPSAQERDRDRGGVITSPFFERPTAVANPRKVDISVSFGF